MRLTYSEVGCCQDVSSMPIFTDQRGGVSFLAAVLTGAFFTSNFTDAGRKDHLDAPRLISHWEQRQRKKEKQAGHSCSH